MPEPQSSHKDTYDSYLIRQLAQQIATLDGLVDKLLNRLQNDSQPPCERPGHVLISPDGINWTWSRKQTSVLLPGEAPRDQAPLPWEENPAPDSRSPLEAVISQQTAIRVLVRHYGWAHNGPNILFRPDWLGRSEVTSPASTSAEPPLIELQETPGEIADLGAAAAAAVA